MRIKDLKPGIDLCIVASRRPELLNATLTSFNDGMLNRFDIINVFANIDPIWGDQNDHEKTIAVLRSHFPRALINEPKEANFCAAVRNNWLQIKSPYAFHLEDDWEMIVPQDASILAPFDIDNVKQVALNCREKHWDFGKGNFHLIRKSRRTFGVKLPVKQVLPAFTTSPSFVERGFAIKCASLYDIRFDPEKQFFEGVNPVLQKFVRDYSVFLSSDNHAPIIRDIGREWRNKRNIEKQVRRGKSIWKQTVG